MCTTGRRSSSPEETPPPAHSSGDIVAWTKQAQPAREIRNARTFKLVMGIRVSEWARNKQLCPALVYSVVSGQRKCLRGVSLQIAQELGMK